ncbi:hypothetical protein ABT373_20090 [Streptomyces sp. NPDC000070]|uniref:hypothetical protein n=1 Tax=Streptomyces sp. NPDC000070 TaxID=3154240 RepID=UPI003317E7F7
MSFAERLYRYLVGEDMAGPNRSVFYTGPVKREDLPMTAEERGEPWYARTAGCDAPTSPGKKMAVPERDDLLKDACSVLYSGSRDTLA